MIKKIISIFLSIAVIAGIVFVSADIFTSDHDIVISNLKTKHLATPDEDIINDIIITPCNSIKLELQRYDEIEKGWKIEQIFAPQDSNFTLEYPSIWKQSMISKWRLHISSTIHSNEYYSPEITINCRNIEEIDLQSQAAVIIDAQSGIALYDKDMDSQRAVASTTKLMTALICLENCELDDKVKITYPTTQTPYSKLYMSVGDEYYVEKLLSAMLMVSSNDAASALAIHIGGSEKGFAKMMNKRAEQLGLKNSHFVTPNGLPASNQYSSAYDMAIVHKELLKQYKYVDISRRKTDVITNVSSSREKKIKNTCKLLKYDGYIAGKSGVTDAAGYCFCGAYEKNGRTYIFTTLHANSGKERWKDCKKIIKYIEKYA